MEANMQDLQAELANLHCALGMLVKPADEASKGELHDILELNMKDALAKLKVKDLSVLKTLEGIKCCVTLTSSVRWKFVCITLHILLKMKDCLKKLSLLPEAKSKSETKAPLDVLSVSQQKTIRTCLQFVVSMGLLPSLIPGVGISLAARCTSAQNLKAEDLLVLEKYERLSGVTRGLLACCEHPSLRSLMVTNHLGDLMAALSQISFAPLKKPAPGQQGAEAAAREEFVMTQELWARFQQDRAYFRNCFVSFIWQVYQPFVIRELLLLHGAAGLKRLQSCNRAAPPSWLKRACVQLLVHCLMRPRGVSALVRAICDTHHDSGKDWSKLETVVSLITTVHTTNPEQYFRNICAQIMEILSAGEKAHTHLQIMVAVKCIEVIFKRDPNLITEHLTDALMEPLRKCGASEQSGDDKPPEKQKADQKTDSVIVSEDDLSKCIVNMHRIFVECCGKDCALPPSVYLSVSPILFALYRKIYTSASFLVAKVETLLIKFLSSLQADVMDKVFKMFLFGDVVEDTLAMDTNRCVFAFGPTGGVVVEPRKENESPTPKLQDAEEAGDCLLHLLTDCDQVGNVTTNLFMTLLQVLCGDPKDGGAKTNTSDELLELEDEACMVGTRERHYVAVKLLSVLSNSIFVHERINNDPNYLIDYFLYILERDFKYLTNHNIDVNKGGPAIEDLVMVIMTVAVALSNIGSKGKPIDWKPFEGIVEPLKMIRDNVENEELKMLASEVYNMIVTRGVIQESTVGEASGPVAESLKKRQEGSKKKEDKKKKKKEPLASEGNATAAEEVRRERNSRAGEELNSNVKDYFKDLNPYKEAVLYVCDSVIPVHGHGLLQLTKLIVNGDAEAKAKKNVILKIFQDDLKCEDSYIYLLAINGLAAMANMFPGTVIRLLVAEFLDVKGKKDMEDTTDLKLKIGEVLVRVSKSIDPNATTYTTMMLDAFLKGARDCDPLVRASSLSNLGQVCKALGFRINFILQEILMCVKSILQSDPSVDVRSAAAMVLTLLLQGLGPDTFSVLGDTLQELYRGLKHMYQKETNDTLKLHLQLALEEINKTTMEFMFPEQKLEKKVYVLDPPPSV